MPADDCRCAISRYYLIYAWAQLYHQGVRRGIKLRTAAGRAALVRAEVSPAGRQLIECALRVIDHLDRQLEPLDKQLIAFARRTRAERHPDRQLAIAMRDEHVCGCRSADQSYFSE